MRASIIALTLVSFLGFCEAVPTASSHVIHEKRSSTPRRWVKSNRVDKDSILPIRIGLTQKNLENAEKHLMDVSHPDSPNYGKHWTPEEVYDMFAPSAESVQVVRSWLVAAGVDDNMIIHSDNKGWLALSIPAWLAEQLFQTEYHEHIHADSGHVRIGSDKYSLPEHVREHVDFITPGVKFSAVLKKSNVKRDLNQFLSPILSILPLPDLVPWQPPPAALSLPPNLQGCARNITPDCLRALYQIPKARKKDSVNQLGLFERYDTYAQEDLDLFYADYAPYVPKGTSPLLKSIDGGQAPVPPGSPLNRGESDVDIDIAFSLIWPQTVTLYQVDDPVAATKDRAFNTFLDALDGSYCTYSAYGTKGNSAGIDPVYPDPAAGGYKGQLQCGVYKPTRVISVSYGDSEYDQPLSYTQRQCNEFLKLGLQGHTFVWSSGDYGVASFPGDNNKNGCLGKDSTIYNPGFPTCPYVTSVGATRLYAKQTVLDKESALQINLGPGAELVASSGGFANYFPVPSYQKSAVEHYFKYHDPGLPSYVANAKATNIGAGKGLYNRAGRGLPDVSANGANFKSYNNLKKTSSYGTSLSAPIWGSIVTLINEERTAVGKGPVGFINPVLYQHPWVFNDIVNGSNPGCGSKGFSAVEGWDPVTGLGTPKYPALLALFLSLP